ncbi:MAG: acyltransferase [Candidatus Omnitrophica bacterium]|nr:acyltransferase [Candidatus Omnitrophota bacterium]
MNKYHFLKLLAHWYFFEFGKLRSKLYTFMMKKTGKKIYIFPPFRCSGPEGITLGNEVVIAENCVLGGQGGLTIGNFVMIGNNSTIITANHGFSLPDIPMLRQPLAAAPVTINDDVWLGANVVVLPGVTIGQGAIVGAGAIVTKDIEPYSIVAGNPAKLLRKRFDEATIKKLLSRDSLLYKYYETDFLRTNKPKIYNKPD